MKRFDCLQNTPEWHALRCGIPTASAFHKIVTPKTGKPSTQAADYMNIILAELILGRPFSSEEYPWMKRGHELEPEAIRAFEFVTDLEVERVGFVTTDDGLIGASPDGFVGPKKGIEIKCPKPHNHVGYLLDGTLEDDYRPQIQGLIWICERDAWDTLSYYPEIPPAVMTVTRDEEYLAKMVPAIREFSDRLQEKIALLITRGLIKPDWKARMTPKVEEPFTSSDFISNEDLERILAANRAASTSGMEASQ